MPTAGSELHAVVGWLAALVLAFWLIVIVGCIREDMKERKSK